MEIMKNNFKNLTIYKVLLLAGALLMAIGSVVPYVEVSDFVEESKQGVSLFKAWPVGGIIVVAAAITIIAAVGLNKKIVAIAGSVLGLIANVASMLIIKTPDRYYKLIGLGDQAESLNNLAEFIGSDEYMKQTIDESFHYEAGLYLIFIGAAITLALSFIAFSKKASPVLSANQAISSIKNSDSIKPIVERAKISLTAEPWVCEKCGTPQ